MLKSVSKAWTLVRDKLVFHGTFHALYKPKNKIFRIFLNSNTIAECNMVIMMLHNRYLYASGV